MRIPSGAEEGSLLRTASEALAVEVESTPGGNGLTRFAAANRLTVTMLEVIGHLPALQNGGHMPARALGPRLVNALLVSLTRTWAGDRRVRRHECS